MIISADGTPSLPVLLPLPLVSMSLISSARQKAIHHLPHPHGICVIERMNNKSKKSKNK